MTKAGCAQGYLHSMQRHEAARGVEPAPPQLLVPQTCKPATDQMAVLLESLPPHSCL